MHAVPSAYQVYVGKQGVQPITHRVSIPVNPSSSHLGRTSPAPRRDESNEKGKRISICPVIRHECQPHRIFRNHQQREFVVPNKQKPFTSHLRVHPVQILGNLEEDWTCHRTTPLPSGGLSATSRAMERLRTP